MGNVKHPESRTKVKCLICGNEREYYKKQFNNPKEKGKYCRKCYNLIRKIKRIEKTCSHCDNKFKLKINEKRKYCSSRCYHNATKGKNSINWRGGVTNERFLGEWNKIRKRIYKRDNYTCQICKIKKSGNNIRLHAHHIVPYRITSDNSDENLITLCNGCHNLQERLYYSTKLEE